jgi:c-di-GMP-binding flagellar brake protein YcgR
MPETNNFIEKREFPRVRAKVPVKYRLVGHQEAIESIFERRKDEQSSQTGDISLGGMYLPGEPSLSVGTLLRMEIHLPNAPNKLPAFAEVVWTNGTGGGIQFLSMKENDKESLQSYLEKTSS